MPPLNNPFATTTLPIAAKNPFSRPAAITYGAAAKLPSTEAEREAAREVRRIQRELLRTKMTCTECRRLGRSVRYLFLPLPLSNHHSQPPSASGTSPAATRASSTASSASRTNAASSSRTASTMWPLACSSSAHRTTTTSPPCPCRLWRPSTTGGASPGPSTSGRGATLRPTTPGRPVSGEAAPGPFIPPRRPSTRTSCRRACIAWPHLLRACRLIGRRCKWFLGLSGLLA